MAGPGAAPRGGRPPPGGEDNLDFNQEVKSRTPVGGDRENEFKQRLKGSLLDQEYQTWFRPVRLRIEPGQAVTVVVPNHFFADWIRERYHGVVEQALAATFGEPLPVVFDLDPGMGGEERSRETAPRQEEAPEALPSRSPLNRRYTFANFVVGPCNELAHAACRAVAENPGAQYNPLFIFGGAGLGKTHLLLAAGNHILENSPGLLVHYSTSEDFTNELIKAVRFDGIHTFKAKFRKVDCLLLDDIQFLAGRERTQEELFHTFNTLFEAGKQIIVTSDKMPREIPALEKRLRTRFEWGLLADLQPPDEETKVAILMKKAAEKGISLARKVAFFLASQPEGNVRVLEGYLTRLVAVSRLKEQEIGLELARQVLGPMVGERVVTMDEVLKAVATGFGVKVSDLKGERKTRDISLPRQVAMLLARRLTTFSFPEIGKALGGKDHSTVVKGVKKLSKTLATDQDLARKVLMVEKVLLEGGRNGEEE